MPTNEIDGCDSTDTICLADVPYDKYGIATLTSGNALQIKANGKTYTLNVVEHPTRGVSFHLSSDGSHGTNIQLAQGFAGFDAGNFPGLGLMQTLITKTNLSWAGYYLDTPFYNTQDQFTPWQGNWKSLTSQGWNLAPIFVGQQNYSQHPVTLANAVSIARSDSTEATNELLFDGIPKGTVVYLDIEPNANLSLGELAYIASWCASLSSSGYFAGVYCLPGQARTIHQIVPSAPFWITHTVTNSGTPIIPTVPNGGVILPAPALSLSGYGTAVQAWQYLINTYSFTPVAALNNADLDSFAQAGTVLLVANQTPIVNVTVNNGSSLTVPSDTTAIGTTINDGGVESVNGSDFGTTIYDGGYQYVLAGGTTAETLVLDPGVQVIGGQGTADGSILSGGEQDVYGTASNTDIESGGLQIVESGGTATGTVISGGGSEHLNVGGTDVSATIIGGKQEVYGFASSAIIFAGLQEIKTGGTACGTVISGGSESLNAGGTDVSAAIFGGEQEVYGFASAATIFAGLQEIESGGTATDTSISGGMEIVGIGGTDFGAVIVGGEQDVFGNASGTVVSSGFQILESSGTASGTTVLARSNRHLGFPRG
jgi:autotransporter passenger strand-loop-strand repeat protein